MTVYHRRFVAVLTLLVSSMVLPAWGQPDGTTITGSAALVDLVVRSEAGGAALSLGGGDVFRRTTDEVVGARVIDVAGSAARLVLWNEVSATGTQVPFYAITLDGQSMATVRQTSYELKLRHGDFDPRAGVPAVATGLEADATSALYIVQFVTQPLGEFRFAITELGGTVRHFLANHAHIVEMDAATRERVSALPYVRWVGPYHPAYRLEELMRDEQARADELFPLQRYNIQVFEAGLGQKETVAARIEALGGKVDRADAGKYLVVATLTPDQLYEVARWNEVLFIDRWSAYEQDMDIVREIGGANHIETVAGYTGQGVRGEAFDAGCNVNHPDFLSRPPILHGSVGVDAHGTATCGVCFGDGTGDPRARGLMPDGQPIVADYNSIGLTGPNRYTHTGELLEDPYYGVFQTASVGSDRTTQYSTISADKDAALFDFDIVHCQSQSNAGDQMSRPEAWAKNIISGGAVYHYDTPTKADDCWCFGASIGPATDGRIKPDLCFFYDETYTTYSTSSSYGEFGGTSGATPSIAGHVGLFHQMWSEGIFGNEVYPPGGGPTGYDVFDNRPHMTTAKAFMINTADQYPFSSTTDDKTRVHQGWGMPDLEYMYEMRENISFINETELLGNMESVEYSAYIEPGEPAMRVTLVYADPPGVPSSSQHRINDLTLKVTSPSGTEYWGNNGLLEGNWSVPGGSANTVDTVENVFVENPEAGVWAVAVIASEVNEDGHVETPELDADFALVLSGGFLATCSSEGRLTLGRSLYSCQALATIRVVDCDLNGDDGLIETAMVTIASDSEPGGEIVVLTETAPETADFRGTIQFSLDDSAGVLQVSQGETVVATYVDEDDGHGGFDIEVTATATLDCIGPMISNVALDVGGSGTVTVTFDTDESAVGTIRYGLSCGELTQSETEAGRGTSHEVVLTGLDSGTRYRFVVDAEDDQGNVSTDDHDGECYTIAGDGTLAISFPDGLPLFLPPTTPFDLTVGIDAGDEQYVAGSGTLYVRYDGGAYQSVALEPLGGDLYTVTFPAARCDDVPEFYLVAEGTASGMIYSPATAPSSAHTAGVGILRVEIDDDFETDQGWTVDDSAGLTSGTWQRGVPVGGGDRGDPPTDFDGSGRCYVTQNIDGDFDIDDGTTWLISPTLDLSDGDADVSYALWYTNDFGADPHNDVFVVWVSNDDGANWTEVETFGPTSAAGWTEHTFTVGDYVTPTSTIKVRFEASDLGSGSVVEAGIDAFLVDAFSCDDCVGDLDGDGSIGLGDLAVLLANYDTPSGATYADGDLSGDGAVDLADLAILLAVYGTDCD